MRLKKLTIDNFRNIEHADIEFTRARAAFIGENWQGKSSIRYAVQMLQHGTCSLPAIGTPGRQQIVGRGAEQLIRHGADSAHVQGVYETPVGDVGIMLTLQPRKNEWVCFDPDTGATRNDIQSRVEFWRAVGIDETHAMIACMPEAYLESRELGDALGECISDNVDIAAVLDAAGEFGDWLTEFGKMHGLTLISAGNLQAIGAKAFDRRTQLKRDVKEAETLAAQHEHVSLPKDKTGNSIPVEAMPALSKKLQTLRNDRDTLNLELGAAQTRGANRDTIMARIAELGDADARLSEAKRVHANAEREESQAATAHAGLVFKQSNAMREAKKANVLSVAVQSECLACHRPFSDADKARMLVEWKAQRDAADYAVNAVNEQVRDALAALAPIRKQKDHARADVEKATEDARELAALKKQLHDMGGAARPIEVITAALARSDESLALAEAAMEQLRKCAAHGEALDTANAMNAELIRIDWCVRSFKDGALLKSMMGDGLEHFCGRCNDTLAAFDMRMTSDIDGKNICLRIDDTPVSLCSNGQKAVAQCAVALAFADGAPVLLDDVNDLTEDNLRTLIVHLHDASLLVFGTLDVFGDNIFEDGDLFDVINGEVTKL